MDKKKWYTKFMVIKPDQYNMKYIIIASLVFLSSCVTLDDHISEAEKYCHNIFKQADLNLSKSENNKWNRRQYVQCVSNTTNAVANTNQARAAWYWVALSVASFISYSLTTIINSINK